ncbi:M15 family metallopeptidase [Pseudoxanthomonas kalamensis]|uniref:M15 family metallopeptidase n=1 Tax=Pseudoxanthomonas kalamensis TaxID=289483 RepID=UPI0031B5741E
MFALLAVTFLLHAQTISPATRFEQTDLIDLTRLAPDILLDIRYATADNFVGVPVRGYEAPKCYLLAPAAAALVRLEHELRAQGYALKVFDCYRPARAVAHFVEWSQDLSDRKTKPGHYPDLDKSQLMGEYIAPVSGHSKGATVDLTLMRCEQDDVCRELDMGTDFDLFGPQANTDSSEVTKLQHENRLRLRRAMESAGFRNYPLEWWHYSFQAVPAPELLYDIPVK